MAKKLSPKVTKELSKIKSGALSRGFSLVRMSMNVGAKAASHAIGGVFSSADPDARLKALLSSQLEVLTRELGQLKGSVMKVGQMLSVYGEYFLPEEANQLLKSLQNQAPPLGWKEIEKVLIRELGKEKLELLEISRKPIASASLGQVHRAVVKSDQRVLALKIQYPGVDKAIEGDLKILKYVLSVTKLIPKGPQYEQVFEEIRQMLYQEVDYAQELKSTEEFKNLLKDYPQYVVPTPVKEFSTRKILATSLEEGVPVDSPEVKNISQDRRNKISSYALELYFLELFRFGLMQTDPHFGNYRIRLAVPAGNSDQGLDKLVLFDFGAARKFSPEFVKNYRNFVWGALHKDVPKVEAAATAMDFLRPDDPPEVRQAFVDLCVLLIEPFQRGVYAWGENDLPKRAGKEASRVAFAFKLRAPPREIVFLDRKLGGVFIFLAFMKAEIDARALLESYLTD